MSQKENLRPSPSASGSVQQSLFLDFVARQRSSRVSSSLLASFQPSRIFNEKQLYKHMVSVHYNAEKRLKGSLLCIKKMGHNLRMELGRA